jgi:N-acetylated-alpha-linked acidic dipeptidase
MPVYPGDPLTPFIGAVRDAARIAIKDAPTLAKIPVLPISYEDALPMLRDLDGPVAPEEWRGALPITYHLGPGKSIVHLNLEFNWDIKPIYDVIAKISGSEFPDQWIVRGNHHDAWVNGAEDPISGQVALMGEAKSIGELVRSGWKPKRTILYCAWDGEEPGLLGSTEWVETHAEELKAKCAVYINSDGNGRGFFFAGGSHILQNFINEISREVIDPEKNVSVYERGQARMLVVGTSEQKKNAMEKKEFRISPLGSGSDYSPFLQHIGISSLNLSFGGESEDGAYHSIYDSYDHYIRFGDPGFKYGVVLSEIGGHAMIELADYEILPFRFTDLSEELNLYVREISNLADEMRDKASLRKKLMDDNAYEEFSDPMKTYIPPKAEEPVPYLNFAPLQNVLVKFEESARDYTSALASYRNKGRVLPHEKMALVDSILINTERALTSSKGLPGRPWYIHMVYAPGLYTGYGVKTLPGVRESIEQKQWNETPLQIETLCGCLSKLSDLVERAAKILESE